MSETETLKQIHGTEEASKLLAYLENDLGNCLYLYLDVEAYGLDGDIVSVWEQLADDGDPIAVAMKYSDSFQLYARESSADAIDYPALLDLTTSHGALRVHAPKFMIDRLSKMVSSDVDVSYGSIIELKSHKLVTYSDVRVEEAERSDYPEIVKLILKDEDLGMAYDEEALIAQFEERHDDGVGKSFVIREGGKIIASTSLVAMTEKMVIPSLTIVDPEKKDRLYGALLDSFLINDYLKTHQKRGFAFMQEPRRVRIFERMGNPVVGEYGKLRFC